MVNVLIVDDSSFVRRSMTSALEADPEIKVVATASDGTDALAKLKDIDVDVVTLDVEMPRMDGLKTLQELMRVKPVPVIMVSSQTAQGAETTLKAMEYGALDFIPKDMEGPEFAQELRRKVKIISRQKAIVRLRSQRLKLEHTVQIYPTKGAPAPPPPPGSTCKGARDLVVIGVSTGGPPVVQKILAALPRNLQACILIAQHMPASFTGPFANRLDAACQISVSEAADGDKYLRGHAYVCPGGRHISVRMRGAIPEVHVSEEPKDAIYKPTVNLLMSSAGNGMGPRTLGVMLTGMGSDGCEGARVLRAKGGYLIAQSEASCVVYGMPKAVVDEGLANQIVDADNIAQAIMSAVRG
jgi:two-component system chemotaxis response regulator CheB